MRKFFACLILISAISFAGCTGTFLNKGETETINAMSTTPAQREAEPPFNDIGMQGEGGLYVNLYDKAERPSVEGRIYGAITPHHMIAGSIAAELFKSLSEQKPELIVLFGPDHNNIHPNSIVSTLQDWQTEFGPVLTEKKIVSLLAKNEHVIVDDKLLSEEYSISSLVPLVKLALPDTPIITFVSPFYTSSTLIDDLSRELQSLAPENTVYLASVDFSHYQNSQVAKYHDDLSVQTVKNLDYARLSKLDIDSPSALRFLFRSMELKGSEKIIYEKRSDSSDFIIDDKLNETTSYYSAYFTKGEKENEPVASILNFGDMMLDRSVKLQADKNGLEYILQKLAGKEDRFFTGVDAIQANLEGPFANFRRTTNKEIAFCFDPVFLPILKKYHFSFFSQANNHSFDMGYAGFEESKNNLKQYGIEYYGSQYRVGSDSAIIKRIGDFDVGLIGLNDTNGWIDVGKTVSLIEEVNNKSDFTIVNVHWGEEYKNTSNKHQREIAHFLIDAGVDIIIGHHPHVVQEMEVYKKRPIFYSLGNFVFDQYFSEETQQGLAIGLVLKKDSISAYIVPLEQNLSQTYQMPPLEKDAYLKEWFDRSRIQSYSTSENKVFIDLN